MARKFYSICVNDEKNPGVVDLLESLAQGNRRNGFLVELLQNYIDTPQEQEQEIVYETDPLMDKITENLEVNTQIMSQMNNTMQMFCNLMANGTFVAHNMQQMALTQDTEEEEEEEEEMLSDEVVDGILGGW